MITGNEHFGNREPRKIPTFQKWINDKVMPELRRAKIIVSDLKVSDAEPVKAFINNNRWIWQCECGGAEFAWEEGLGMCMSCLNAGHKHQLRKIVFPRERGKIEWLMVQRPTINRHWKYETVDELQKENDDHKKELLGGIKWLGKH